MLHEEQISGPLQRVRDLECIDRLGVLDQYGPEMTEATARLLAGDADPLEVTQAVALGNDQLTARLLDLAQARLGPPPFAFSWLALGSHGRGEQDISSDQDSALPTVGRR